MADIKMMDAYIIAVIMIYSPGLVSGAGSENSLSFKSSTDSILPSLTDAMNMSCDVINNSSFDVVNATNNQLIGKRDAVNMSSSGDIQFLSAITILRNGEKLATVTEHTKPSRLGDVGNMKVEGQISGNSGFLRLSWDDPDEVQSGDYSCQASGFDSQGQSSVSSHSLSVGVTEPSVNDLVKFISKQRKAINRLESVVRTQNETNTYMQNEIFALKTCCQSQQQFITSINNTVNQQKKTVSHLGHVESGKIYCGGSDSWFGLHPAITKTVHFKTTYATAPVVHLGVSKVDEHDSTYFDLDLLSVSTDHFTMRCGTYHGEKMDSMDVSWLAVPK